MSSLSIFRICALLPVFLLAGSVSAGPSERLEKRQIAGLGDMMSGLNSRIANLVESVKNDPEVQKHTVTVSSHSTDGQTVVSSGSVSSTGGGTDITSKATAPNTEGKPVTRITSTSSGKPVTSISSSDGSSNPIPLTEQSTSEEDGPGERLRRK